ncbi:FUSC family protein [Azotobacter chroococcum]|uniref:FUSC family protein n=1 Tax=Azotobacter chroococcum TaxID=353 RepID=A0AA43ZBP6_9GAMM|nr:FUSC family protein [Azotobacter chroococcum]NHN79292.1 FUSC family protein [Azotobacter chroococcum]
MKTVADAPVGAFRRALGDWALSEGLTWVFVFKALLTAFVALWLAYRLELPQPSTVLATVFIVMQRQSGEVLAKSFYRIVGTLLGLVVMVTLIALFNQERVLFLLCLAIWVGLCTAGAARYRDFRGYACVLAGYTAVMIGLPATFDPDGAFMQALWRVLEITVGILCTGLVMGLILPQTSGATLRSTLATRFRDFAGVACAGLAGELEPQRMEEVSARLAAQAVALENLRNASAFEDPNIRLRSGRLARLNNEFMVLSTRFHALYQLLQRLQGETGVRVLEALQPCLAQVGSELAPLAGRLYSDQDAANLALGLATSKQALMQRIRDGRQQLVEQQADEAQLTDFNTASELLFRFADDLHNYAQTQASLADQHHSREKWKGNFTPRANGLAAAVAGIRCALLILALSAFWLASSWPSGSTFVLTAGLVSALSSTSSNPARLSRQLLIGASGSAVAGFVLQFWVFPWLDGFALLYASLVPVIAFGAFLLARPQTLGYGVGLLIWFCMLALPANQTHYLPYRFFNEYLAVLSSMGLVVVSMLILPPDRPWLWRRLEQDLRMRVVFAVSGKLKGLVDGFESGTRDLLNQAYGLAARRPDVQRQLLRWMFAVLEIGHAVIELRQEQAALPDEPCYAADTPWQQGVRAMGRALVRLFIQPDEANRQRALAAVEQAIQAVRDTPEPRPPQFDSSPLRRVLSYLHFIRSSLLDPRSPLAEGSANAAGRLANAP